MNVDIPSIINEHPLGAFFIGLPLIGAPLLLVSLIVEGVKLGLLNYPIAKLCSKADKIITDTYFKRINMPENTNDTIAVPKIPKDPKKLRRFLDHFDRSMTRRENNNKRLSGLQTQVQRPHLSLDYASHVRKFGEGPNAPALYGFELEIERAPKYAGLKKILDLTLGEENYYVTTDGSLRDNGLEIVSLPFPKEDWYQKQSKLHNFLTLLSMAGCRSHDVDTCGLHISTSGNALPSYSHWKALQYFLKANEVFFKDISRRDNFIYCCFSEGGEKYSALNIGALRSMGVASCPGAAIIGDRAYRGEFRFFRGTLKPRSFLASMECIFALVEWWKEAWSTVNVLRPTEALDSFKAHVVNGKYFNLHDYLFERGHLDNPSPRYSKEDSASSQAKAILLKKKREAEQKARREAKLKEIKLKLKKTIQVALEAKFMEHQPGYELPGTYHTIPRSRSSETWRQVRSGGTVSFVLMRMKVRMASINNGTSNPEDESLLREALAHFNDITPLYMDLLVPTNLVVSGFSFYGFSVVGFFDGGYMDRDTQNMQVHNPNNMAIEALPVLNLTSF